MNRTTATPRRPRAAAADRGEALDPAGLRVVLTLPWPPTGNLYWRKTRAGRIYPSNDAVAYKQAAALAALGQRCPRFLGPVALTLDFYPPDRRGDGDNRVKVLQDSLEGLAYANDRQVRRMAWELHEPDRADPRVVMVIEPYAATATGGRA
jgi:Holliday junction resolvase RusA-like endonuclease